MPQPRRRRLFRLTLGATSVAWLGWGAGQMFREATWLTGLGFFWPSPVLVVLLAGVAGWAWIERRRGVALLAVLAALAPLLSVCLAENHWRPKSEPVHTGVVAPPVIRLVHWNICRGCRGLDGLVAELRRRPADIYVLSESPADAEWARLAASWGPGWQAVYREELVVLARGRLTAGFVRVCQGPWSRPVACSFPVEWTTTSGVSVRLLVTDVTPRLSVPRRPILEWLRAQVLADAPDIVVGDLNTPRQAALLSPLAAGYRHAYDLADSGWSYTWPTFAPVLAIDHLFVGPRLSVRSYTLESTAFSDHRLQDAVLAVGRH